jgi:NADP-dependent 3-hydroxy acid dehydrogenase YdfG
MSRLSGKVAIVTGASSGIGRATSKALATEGAMVVMCSRSLEKLEAAAKDVPGAVCISMDVVDRKAVHAMVADVMAKHGRIDLLVNCAGVMYFTLMKNLHYDEWEQTIDINCKGVVNTSGAVLPHMLSSKAGHVINISSDAARTVFPALTVYNAAKSFVQVFSKGLRAECVGTGVRVTDIQPGDTATNLIMTNSDKEAADKMGVGIGAVVGGGEVGPACLAPADIADAVVYAATAAPHIGVHEILIEPRDQVLTLRPQATPIPNAQCHNLLSPLPPNPICTRSLTLLQLSLSSPTLHSHPTPPAIFWNQMFGDPTAMGEAA